MESVKISRINNKAITPGQYHCLVEHAYGLKLPTTVYYGKVVPETGEVKPLTIEIVAVFFDMCGEMFTVHPSDEWLVEVTRQIIEKLNGD